MRKTKRKRPEAALRLGEAESSAELGFDFLLQALARSPHPVNHGGNEDGAHQHQPAFVGVLDDLKAMNHISGGEARGNGGDQPPPDVPAPRLASGLLEVTQDNAQNERRFDAFPKCNDE